MNNSKINLNFLFPDFTQLNFIPQTTDELSTWIIVVLITVFCISCAYVLLVSRKTKRQVNWLIKLLKAEAVDMTASSRSEILTSVKEEENDVSHQWQEFNETLVEVREGEHLALYNTLDSAHFFNNTTIGSSLSGNRLLAAIPGILTAIGVIGTFAGLQLSLSDLHITGNASVEEMKQGVSGVIGGAKVAFVTSLWGIFLSLLFNLFEKYREQNVRRKISELQTRIDALFPRLSPEEQLQKIANSSEESQKSLQGLAEQIGHRMQTSIEEVMGPAIRELIDSTKTSNSSALESVIEQFMDKFGELGEAQRKAIDSSSQSLNKSMEEIASNLKSFSTQLTQQETSNANNFKDFISLQEAQMGAMRKNIEELDNSFKGVVSGIEQQTKESDMREDTRNNHLKNILAEQNEVVSQRTEGLLDKFEGAVTGVNTLIEQGKQLQNLIQQSEGKQEQIIQGMSTAAKELTVTSNHIRSAGDTLATAGNNLAESITQATQSTEALSQENQITAKRLMEYQENLHKDLQHFVDSSTRVSEKIQDMLQSAGTTLDTLKDNQKVFLDNLQMRVDDLNKSMKQSLQDYAEQANGQTAEYLKVWTSSVNEYSVKMNSAVNALSSVVDEIQGKIGD